MTNCRIYANKSPRTRIFLYNLYCLIVIRHDKSDHLQKSRRSNADPLLSACELCLCRKEQHHAPDIGDVLLAIAIEVCCMLLFRAGKAVHQTALEQ